MAELRVSILAPFDALQHAEICFHLLTLCLLRNKVGFSGNSNHPNNIHQISALASHFNCSIKRDLISGLLVGLQRPHRDDQRTDPGGHQSRSWGLQTGRQHERCASEGHSGAHPQGDPGRKRDRPVYRCHRSVARTRPTSLGHACHSSPEPVAKKPHKRSDSCRLAPVIGEAIVAVVGDLWTPCHRQRKTAGTFRGPRL